MTEKLYKLVNGVKTELSEQEVQEFLKQPTTEEKKDSLKKVLISSRKNYLALTDWYIAREIDEPNSYPEEIKAARIKAREEINEIEACTTLKQLAEYDSK